MTLLALLSESIFLQCQDLVIDIHALFVLGFLLEGLGFCFELGNMGRKWVHL